jgi:hypothetical protein
MSKARENVEDIRQIDTNAEALENVYTKEEVDAAISGIDLSTKQDTLESGTSIKTINNESLLGAGNIDTASNSRLYFYGGC